MKLAGGSRKLYAQMDKEAFLQQGRDYEDMGKDALNSVLQDGHDADTRRTRSPPSARWRSTPGRRAPEYAAILRGDYPKMCDENPPPSAEAFADTPPDDARTCPNCSATIRYRAFVFCPDCGADLPR